MNYALNSGSGGVDISGGSGIIESKKYSDSSDEFVKITEESIKSIPEITEFETTELNQAVQDGCKQILSDLIADEIGTEESMAIAFDLNAEPIVIKGEQGAGGVLAPTKDIPYLTLHNHPSCQTFSAADITKLYDDSNCKAVAVIGNNGKSLFVMKKDNNFNSTDFFEYVMKKKYGFSSYTSDYEFMKGAEQYGVKYYERTD